MTPDSFDARSVPRLASTQIKDLGCKAGVVLNPATPLSAIENVLSFVGAPGGAPLPTLLSAINRCRAGRRYCE